MELTTEKREWERRDLDRHTFQAEMVDDRTCLPLRALVNHRRKAGWVPHFLEKVRLSSTLSVVIVERPDLGVDPVALMREFLNEHSFAGDAYDGLEVADEVIYAELLNDDGSQWRWEDAK